jgi:hypothetical protein
MSEEPRLEIEENFWLVRGEPEELDCPPSGRILRCRYGNGDGLRVEFFDLDAAAMESRYPGVKPERWDLSFPVTAVEVSMKIAGTEIDFGARQTKIGGVTLRGNFTKGGNGLVLHRQGNQLGSSFSMG